MFNGLGIFPIKTVNGSRYYFTRLNDEQQKIYKTILSGIQGYTKEIKMPIRPINEISKIYNYILHDHPMLFYVASSFQQSSDLYKKRCTVIPEYKYTHGEARAFAGEIMRCLQAFDSVKGKSDIEKELYVHDYCSNNFGYDYSFNDLSYSVLGIALNKSAVCEGIAKFVKLTFDYLGLSSLVVSGKAKNPAHDSGMERHAWNIVKIEGMTYHLDVTFDMTIADKLPRYDYFNLSDVDIKADHVIVDDVPTCSVEGKDYYSANRMSIIGLAQLGNYVGDALKQRKRQIVVKVKNEPHTSDIANKVMNIAMQEYSKKGESGVSIETSYNSSQMVFEINYR